MILYLDAEYNDFKGELISMALVSEKGHIWYEVLPCDNPTIWIQQNVIPVLIKPPIYMEDFQHNLEKFICQFDNIHVISDWPEDIMHICNAFITGPGKRIALPKNGVSFQIIPVEYVSATPHNALSDALALKESIELLRIS